MSESLNDFSEPWQESIVGHCLKNYQFLLKCNMYLKHEWFSNPVVGTLMKQVMFIGNKKGGPPTVEEVLGCFSPEESSKYSTYLYRCRASSENVSITLLSDQLTDWIRLINIKKMFLQT